MGTLLRGGAANGRGRGERWANGGARQVRRRAAQHRPIKHPARGAPQPIGCRHRRPAAGEHRERHSQSQERRAAERFVIGQNCRADGPIGSSPWRQFSANQQRRWRGGRGALRRGLGGKMAGMGSRHTPARTARAPLASPRPGTTRSRLPSPLGGDSPGFPHIPHPAGNSPRVPLCCPLCPHIPLQPPQLLVKNNNNNKSQNKKKKKNRWI